MLIDCGVYINEMEWQSSIYQETLWSFINNCYNSSPGGTLPSGMYSF